MILRRTTAALLALAFALPLGAGCARQQFKFENLEHRDKLRFAACRTDVKRHLCPDDPDCDVKAARAYADERADARLQWLIDHECPRQKLLHADKRAEEKERKRIGMPPAP